ncbi:MAG: hypothetical protein AB8B56_10570 [Crocinitomicaceae bacterium]
MERYNQIMLYFWLLVGVFGLVAVTYFGAKEGFGKWAYYYIFPALALLMFLMRRFMMRRMKNHMEYLKQKEAEEAGKTE